MRDLRDMTARSVFLNQAGRGLGRVAMPGWFGLGMGSILVLLLVTRQSIAHSAAQWDRARGTPRRHHMQGEIAAKDMPPRLGAQ